MMNVLETDIQTIPTKTDALSMLANTAKIEHLKAVHYETLHFKRCKNINII